METIEQNPTEETTSQEQPTSSPLKGEPEGGQSSVIIYNQDVHQFREQLRERVVHFIYRKKDGTLRDAYGTTCLENIPSECWPKGTAKGKMPEFIVNYFDIQRNDWRSFNKNNFVGFEDFAPSQDLDEKTYQTT